MDRESYRMRGLVIAATAFAMCLLPVTGYATNTTLQASKTATGSWLREFDWTLNKLVVAPPPPKGISGLGLGKSANVDYKLTAVRTKKADTFRVGGTVCVTNTGPFATKNFTITDELQAKSAAEASRPSRPSTST